MLLVVWCIRMQKVDLSTELHHPLSGNQRLARIRFEPNQHKYYVFSKDGRRVKSNFISVTSVIKRIFPKFNAVQQAQKLVNSQGFKRGHKKYRKYVDRHGASILEDDTETAVQKIVSGWKEDGQKAADLGTRMHKDCENFYNQRPVQFPDSLEHKMFLQYDAYMHSMGFEPFATELMVFGGHISGAVDMLYKHTLTGEIVMRDWKRTKKLSSFGFGSTALFSVFEHLPACNVSKYALQLNLYAAILRKWYAIEVNDMALVVLHPGNSTFIEKKIPRMDLETEELFRFRNFLLNSQITLQAFILLVFLSAVPSGATGA